MKSYNFALQKIRSSLLYDQNLANTPSQHYTLFEVKVLLVSIDSGFILQVSIMRWHNVPANQAFHNERLFQIK